MDSIQKLDFCFRNLRMFSIETFDDRSSSALNRDSKSEFSKSLSAKSVRLIHSKIWSPSYSDSFLKLKVKVKSPQIKVIEVEIKSKQTSKLISFDQNQLIIIMKKLFYTSQRSSPRAFQSCFMKSTFNRKNGLHLQIL